MAELTHPANSSIFELFRNRILQSPTAKVDPDWVKRNLAVSQLSNAAATVRWLKAAKFINEDGNLTDGGRALLGDPESDDYKRACEAAIEGILGEDAAASIRAQTITAANLQANIQSQFGIGESAFKKVAVGLAVLAEQARVPVFQAAFGAPRRRPRRGGASQSTAQPQPKPAGGEDTATVAPPLGDDTATLVPDASVGHSTEAAAPDPTDDRAATSVTPAVGGASGDADIPDESVPVEGNQALTAQPREQTPPSVLASGAVQISIDGTWEIDDIRNVLRWLQMLERRESIPKD